MARKKKDDTIERNEIILQKPMEDIMRDSMIPYAEHVIHRARHCRAWRTA